MEVTSLVEVWIEISDAFMIMAKYSVTSLVEVWIEIESCIRLPGTNSSLPLWKCGLKCVNEYDQTKAMGHFPCGSVD